MEKKTNETKKLVVLDLQDLFSKEGEEYYDTVTYEENEFINYKDIPRFVQEVAKPLTDDVVLIDKKKFVPALVKANRDWSDDGPPGEEIEKLINKHTVNPSEVKKG